MVLDSVLTVGWLVQLISLKEDCNDQRKTLVIKAMTLVIKGKTLVTKRMTLVSNESTLLSNEVK